MASRSNTQIIAKRLRGFVLHAPRPRLTVSFVTLGCAKNEADSRAMSEALGPEGFALVDSYEAAEIIVVNTCAFIEAAVEESLDTILELAALPQVQEGKTRLVVSGCLPSRYGGELALELPEVAVFIPVAEEGRLVEYLTELACTLPARAPAQLAGNVEPPLAAEAPVWAYVKISDGCSRHCSYCTIPAIRGPYCGSPFEKINKEIAQLVARGAREIILIGQDTGIWSDALAGVPSVAKLLEQLAQRYASTWFRIMYLQPEGVTAELLEVMAAHDNIAPYLDIPLQHASASVLKRMNRRGCGSEYLELLERVRAAVPQVVVRTTLICGFPGETEADFDELCSFVAQAAFDYVGIFAYSCEDGTAAAQLEGHLPKEITLSRVQTLRDIADSLSWARAARQVGSCVSVLVCGVEDGEWYGRTQGQAPEVDGVTFIAADADTPADAPADTLEGSIVRGALVSARVVDSVLYDLQAEVH